MISIYVGTGGRVAMLFPTKTLLGIGTRRGPVGDWHPAVGGKSRNAGARCDRHHWPVPTSVADRLIGSWPSGKLPSTVVPTRQSSGIGASVSGEHVSISGERMRVSHLPSSRKARLGRSKSYEAPIQKNFVRSPVLLEGFSICPSRRSHTDVYIHVRATRGSREPRLLHREIFLE